MSKKKKKKIHARPHNPAYGAPSHINFIAGPCQLPTRGAKGETEGLTGGVRRKLAPGGVHVQLEAARTSDALELSLIAGGAPQPLEARKYLEHGETEHDVEVFAETLVRAVAKRDVSVNGTVETNFPPVCRLATSG